LCGLRTLRVCDEKASLAFNTAYSWGNLRSHVRTEPEAVPRVVRRFFIDFIDTTDIDDTYCAYGGLIDFYQKGSLQTSIQGGDLNLLKESRQMVNLRNQIKDVLLSSGCDMVGVANVERFKGAPEGRGPTDILPTARSVIVAAVHILDSVCDDLPETRYEYTNQFYVLNGVLGIASTRVARLLEDLGYRAIPIPAAYPRINKELLGVLSLRHAAVLAGLGEMGLNNLLITPQFGPRVRLVSIITEVPLEPDQPYKKSLCRKRQKECGKACVTCCPVEAISPDGWVNKDLCLRYQEQIMPWSAVELRCGMCLGVCPIGKRQFKIPSRRRTKRVREMKLRWAGAKW
jgi:epoxyqueuosine reductase QueG